MARTICPRCAAPLCHADTCGRCGPVVVGVLDQAPAATGAEPWPEARRWLDDRIPSRDRRRQVVAACCVVAAVALALLAAL